MYYIMYYYICMYYQGSHRPGKVLEFQSGPEITGIPLKMVHDTGKLLEFEYLSKLLLNLILNPQMFFKIGRTFG